MRLNVHTSKHRKSKLSWTTPGLFTGAGFVTLMYQFGVGSTWWAWLIAVLLVGVVDAILFVRPVDTPKVKTRREYLR